jgi:hypothetical protein
MMYNWSNQMLYYKICTATYTKEVMTYMDNNNQWPFYLKSRDLTEPHI